METKIIPLGGLGEFGMNCTVVESGDDIIVIDAGLMFPDESAPGVDVVIPDLTYLFERREKIRAILLTHGHEDHIGALPYLLRDIDAPVYGAPLTLAFIKSKLKEHGIDENHPIESVTARQRKAIGCFDVEFLQVSHSIADALGLAIETPAGIIVHTGDFKIDSTPFLDQATDLQRFGWYGEKGVLALLSDSTNSEISGYTPSENSITSRFIEIFSKAQKKIFVTCFATSISRIQQFLALAARIDRRVVILGRSMNENVEIAHKLGYIDLPEGLLLKREDARTVPPDKLFVIATGSQGEPLSAINRISMHDYPHMAVEEGDTVLISARIIPGNAKSVSRIINRMVRSGAHVFHQGIADVHVSGHGSQEELKLFLRLLHPRFFIPVHGEFRQLYAHADLARQAGIPDSNILIAETGDIISLMPDSAKLAGRVDVGRVFIDVGGIEEVEEAVLHDRKHLSADGFFVIVIAINKSDGSLEGEPEVITRGFLDIEGSDFIKEAQEICAGVISQSTVEEKQDWAAVKEKIRREVRRFLYKRTMKRPIIIPVIMEV